MGNRTIAERMVSVVIRNNMTEMQKSPNMLRVSENPQGIPVESIRFATGS